MALTMRKFVTILLIACFMIASFSGIIVSGNDNPSIEIGRYERITDSGDLSSDHVEKTAAGVRIEGPVFTDTLRVAEEFIDSEIGSDWSANKPFVIEDGEAVVSDRSVEFSVLEIGSSAVFTMGGHDQVEFQQRPMWVSAQQDEPGATITLDMDDGDTGGQEVFIAKQWLWDRGIHRPIVVHEDGTELATIPTEQRDGWVIDMHHFSYVEINPADLTVLGRQGGLTFPHEGERRWYESEHRLEVDVGDKSKFYEVLIEKDWVDMEIPFAAVVDHDWTVERGVNDYYVVGLKPDETPTVLKIYPHLSTANVSDPYANDLYQEVIGINQTSLELSLQAGVVTLPVLGETLLLNASYDPQEVEWATADGQNGTLTMERYKLSNTDPNDEVNGEVQIDDLGYSFTLVFNTTGKWGSYWGRSLNQTHEIAGHEYNEVHFMDPINITIERNFNHTNGTTTESSDPVTDFYGQSMRYGVYLDQAAYDYIVDKTGITHPGTMCSYVGQRFPRSTIPYENVGVDMVRSKCWIDRWGDVLRIDPSHSAQTHLDVYDGQFDQSTNNIDLVVFLSGHSFSDEGPRRDTRGAAWQGPEALESPDDEKRYSVTTILDSRYPSSGQQAEYEATIIILHEMGHNMRSVHSLADEVVCDRINSFDPNSGSTIMSGADNGVPYEDQYCFMFTDERHASSPADSYCGVGDFDAGLNSASRIRCASLIYTLQEDKYW